MIPRILWSVSSRWPWISLFNLEGIPLQDGIGYGGLAQLGERLPCKQEVSGSIPLISTKPEWSQRDGPIAQLARAHD